MRKVDIVRRIAEETACTTAHVEEAVEVILATVKQGLQQGDTVILRRFGTFRVRAKRARVGRNPRSGAAAPIAARRVVRFTPSQTLKQVVDGATTAVE
jgi:nucleoid DNA-binding protein